MDMIIKIGIVLIGGIILIKVFKKASGSLSLNKLNLNSMLFYYSMFYFMIGGSIVFLGFRNHYLIEKLEEEYINKTYIIMLYTLIILPVIIIMVNKLMKIQNYNIFFEKYISNKTIINYNDIDKIFILFLLLTIIGCVAIFYTFYHMGYVPLLEIFKGNFSIITNRVEISNHFTGNEYVRNILALGMVPYLSYIIYIYSKIINTKKWNILFILLFISSILCKTYNFEKAPIILYLLFFLIIKIILGEKIDIQKIFKYILIAICMILFFYYIISGYTGSLFSLSEGPISRILITQVSTLFLHIQTFPYYHNYLNGASFPYVLSWIFPTEDYGVRSGKIVMQLYNSAGVENGNAGVMNTLYIGEAYANFGIIGIIIAPIIVGFIIAFVSNIILKQKKDPINIGLYIIIMNIYTASFVGGFVDYIYSSLGIIILMIIISIKIIVNNGKIKIYI